MILNRQTVQKRCDRRKRRHTSRFDGRGVFLAVVVDRERRHRLRPDVRYPTRVDVTFQRKKGQVVLDQIQTVDKARLVKHLGRLPDARCREVADILQQMFAYE
ncbi:type II toxin-antitoxin system PemK/MazF family toxin [Rhodobacter sp. M37P]|uniref:Type II toxin-antitoxin system PemK/MazF family toxin n=1 Tax=Rhodobacter calidifons TaxID=2715277 RepID=A0ABX0GB53_9RHOB|nr:type II toxin-antitoxin system PemK/MazF family toxin [Rhodobacter calidifons]